MMVAAVVVLALVVLAGVLAVVQRGGPDSPASPPRPGSSAGPRAGAVPGCANVAAPSTTTPTAPPDDLRLEVENRAVIPVSDRYGPATRTAGAWTCFSHSPMGAVMAAQSISTRRVSSPERVTVGEQQLVPNPGRDVYLKAVRARSAQDVQVAPGTFTQPAGFAVLNYSPASAVVLLASRSAKDGQLLSGTLTVVWVDGTWKLRLLPDGSDTPAVTPLTSLTGYIPWGL